MKTWLVTRHGLEQLSLVDTPTPEPRSGQVLVRIRAASVNPTDVAAISGGYGELPMPLIPLGDGAGEIVALGAGVTNRAVGDRVIGTFVQRWLSGRQGLADRSSTLGSTRAGVLSEYAVFDAESTVRIPDYLSFEEASTLPIAGVTAWHALFVDAPIGPRSTVLVQGTGGVAMFAIQLAHAVGARVIVTSSSDHKLEVARKHGATDVINYTTTPDWDVRTRELTGQIGVDLVVDVAGGSLAKSTNAVRFGGQISVIGLLAGAALSVPVVPMLLGNLRLQGISTGSRDMLEETARMLEAHQLHPVIDRTFAFEDAPKALAAIANRESYVGKLVVRGAR